MAGLFFFGTDGVVVVMMVDQSTKQRSFETEGPALPYAVWIRGWNF
jgi:hypothetical protein